VTIHFLFRLYYAESEFGGQIDLSCQDFEKIQIKYAKNDWRNFGHIHYAIMANFFSKLYDVNDNVIL